VGRKKLLAGSWKNPYPERFSRKRRKSTTRETTRDFSDEGQYGKGIISSRGAIWRLIYSDLGGKRERTRGSYKFSHRKLHLKRGHGGKKTSATDWISESGGPKKRKRGVEAEKEE